MDSEGKKQSIQTHNDAMVDGSLLESLILVLTKFKPRSKGPLPEDVSSTVQICFRAFLQDGHEIIASGKRDLLAFLESNLCLPISLKSFPKECRKKRQRKLISNPNSIRRMI